MIISSYPQRIARGEDYTRSRLNIPTASDQNAAEELRIWTTAGQLSGGAAREPAGPPRTLLDPERADRTCALPLGSGRSGRAAAGDGGFPGGRKACSRKWWLPSMSIICHCIVSRGYSCARVSTCRVRLCAGGSPTSRWRWRRVVPAYRRHDDHDSGRRHGQSHGSAVDLPGSPRIAGRLRRDGGARPRRSQAMLTEFTSDLQADAYTGYDALFANERLRRSTAGRTPVEALSTRSRPTSARRRWSRSSNGSTRSNGTRPSDRSRRARWSDVSSPCRSLRGSRPSDAAPPHSTVDQHTLTPRLRCPPPVRQERCWSDAYSETPFMKGPAPRSRPCMRTRFDEASALAEQSSREPSYEKQAYHANASTRSGRPEVRRRTLLAAHQS